MGRPFSLSFFLALSVHKLLNRFSARDSRLVISLIQIDSETMGTLGEEADTPKGI